MKNILKAILRTIGLKISSIKNESLPIIQGMDGGLMNISQHNFNTIIDVGAAIGKWSEVALGYWPYAKYLLIEPLSERKQELEQLCKINPNLHFVPFAAGNKEEEINFYVSRDLDGSGISESLNNHQELRSVNTIRLDDYILKKGMKGPFLIKLDTHGFEIPIIEGCSKIIDDVHLFIIECYGFRLNKNSQLFFEICTYLDKLGFMLTDIVDVVHRPKDKLFWQCDAFFMKKQYINPSDDNSYH